ncbi:MAG: hypothetical protein ACI8UO_005864 [Verrucomicrobiales bacterium]|jgi:hypothetical protein
MNENCDGCGANMIPLQLDLRWQDRYVGEILLPNVRYSQCECCGDQLLPLETAILIDEERASNMNRLLLARPLSEFVSAGSAAAALGFTKQALSKHQRIKRGFIFQVEHEGRTLYLLKSVELFRQKKDGRFPLFSVVTVSAAESGYTESVALSPNTYKTSVIHA